MLLKKAPDREPFCWSVERLNSCDPAVVVGVPDSHRRGGIVDPAFAIEAIGLRQHIFDPLTGFRIESRITAAMRFTGPYFTVLVRMCGVERGKRRRHTVFDDTFFGDIKFD